MGRPIIATVSEVWRSIVRSALAGGSSHSVRMHRFRWEEEELLELEASRRGSLPP